MEGERECRAGNAAVFCCERCGLVNHPRMLDGQLRHGTDSIFLSLFLNKKTL